MTSSRRARTTFRSWQSPFLCAWPNYVAHGTCVAACKDFSVTRTCGSHGRISSHLFVCLFVEIKTKILYFTPCVWREVITTLEIITRTLREVCELVCLYACMLGFCHTLEIITHTLHEVVNRVRLCGHHNPFKVFAW